MHHSIHGQENTEEKTYTPALHVPSWFRLEAGGLRVTRDLARSDPSSSWNKVPSRLGFTLLMGFVGNISWAMETSPAGA